MIYYARGGESSKGIANVHLRVLKKEGNDLSSIDFVVSCGREIGRRTYVKD
jgi:hypothetical protein